MRKRDWKRIAIVLAGLLLLGCETPEIPTHTHVWLDATCTEPRKCPTCKQTDGEPLGHDFAEATCTEPKTCRRCGLTEGEPLGHDFTEATCTEDAVCTRCGLRRPAPGHDFTEATCTEPKTCRRCGLTEGEPLGHDAHPTCTESAVCTRCGTELPALGHDFTEATCIEPKICRRCGQTEGEPLGHEMQDGICTRCGFAVFEPIKGKGNAVLEEIRLGTGVYRVHITNRVSSNLTVWAYDASGTAQLLALARGRYEGTVLLFGESPYTIEVFANNAWEIAFEQLDWTKEESFAGHGDGVTDYGVLPSGSYAIRHGGEQDFVVWLYTTEGETLLVHAVGAFEGERTVTVPEGSYAFFAVRADGDWQIEKTR